VSEWLALYVDIPGVIPDCLSPNDRCERHAKSEAVRMAREVARLSALEGISRKSWVAPLPASGEIAMRWTVFLGKGEKQRDLDNQIARLKAYTDGIFDGLGANDRRVVEVSVRQLRADGDPFVQCAVIALTS
jgi:hypothetical protein